MEEEFVPYKLAIKLKELGFDEPCFAWYYGKDLWIVDQEESKPMNYRQNPIRGGNGILAPLYQQAFRWFREKHGLRFSIVDDHSDNEQPYSFTTEHEYYYDTGSGNNWFKTYEETELNCLNKLIEIVESKSE